MFRFAALLCSRRAPQVAALALISIGFAGCSADMSTRFAQAQSSPSPSGSQSGQFGWQREATGSVVAAVPPAPIERQGPPQYARALPQIQAQALPQPQAQA